MNDPGTGSDKTPLIEAPLIEATLIKAPLIEGALIKVGISSCLLGQAVRYDGGHKLSTLCRDTLGRCFEFVPTCPEAGAGLGIPRPPIQLVGAVAAPRAVQVADSSIDVTARLKTYSAARLPELSDLCGYIFINNSPSCGLFHVNVFRPDGSAAAAGRGIFAAALTSAMPLLPVEEAGRLQDPVLRENFITRVIAWHNWRQLCATGLSTAAIIDFHSRYKYTVMAHSPQQYQVLGRMLSDAGKHDAKQLGERYFGALIQALQNKATRKTNTNVLMHLQGYLKKHLQAHDKANLSAIIEQYRKGSVALSEPVSLLRHYFHLHPDPYIERQVFLQRCPDAPRREHTR